jgi:hypothetical protein
MAGMAGLTEAEKAIYDDFESGGRALLEKAKAAAAAIGADLNAIIGPTEAKVEAVVKKDVGMFWRFLESITQFLDGPNGKFSHKRLLAVAFGAVSIRQFIIGDWFGGVLTGSACIILAVVSAITKT